MHKHLLFLLLLLPILLFSKTDSTLIITGDKNYAPYTYLDANGEPKGMLVDMWKEWAKVTDSKIKFEFKDWIESIESVKNREVDIHSGFYKKEPGLYKAENIHSVKVSLFAKEGYTKKISNQKVGVIEPIYGEKLKKGYPNIKVVLYKNYDQIFKDINDGKLELFYDTTESVLNASTQTDLDALIEIVSLMSKVVHSLQQERGASSGYIGADGKKFKTKLNEIIQNSDAAKKELLISLNLNYKLLKKYIESNERDSLNTLFNELFTLREDVKSVKIDFAKSYSKYTQIIAYLLLNISEISDKVQNKQLMDDLYTYSTLLMYKESIGQKRAALSGLFSQKTFSKEIFEYFLTSDTQEKIYLKSFLHNADKATKEYYFKTLDNDVTAKVSYYEKAALKKLNGETVKVDPEKWFVNATKKIDLVQDVEHKVFNNVLVSIDDIKRKDISSFVRINPYIIIPLKNEFFHSMSPATYDKKLIEKITNGFKKISKKRLNEIENKWINEKNRYYSLFTLEELSWIKKHKLIKVGGERDWAPFDFIDENGVYNCISNDYLKE
ncbi:MAG: transporter substrate-binding domain-containing protein, partial [Sulfurimonas sp.]|nr:transporter substrate-binding domain-containing protein [Sulfurimonas sp.]